MGLDPIPPLQLPPKTPASKPANNKRLAKTDKRSKQHQQQPEAAVQHPPPESPDSEVLITGEVDANTAAAKRAAALMADTSGQQRPTGDGSGLPTLKTTGAKQQGRQG